MGFKDKSISIASYDALGRRILSKEDDETVLIWWGDSECAEYEHRASQDAIQNDIMGHPTRLNSVIARDTEDRENRVELQWYHKNYLDHVYAVSDDDGNLIEHYRYTAFGEPEIYSATGTKRNTSAIANTVMWNTRRYDADNGLYYYKYRHYAANIGRWLGRDPIEEDGGVNLYAFVGNRPLNYWDKFGLQGHGPGMDGSATALDIARRNALPNPPKPKPSNNRKEKCCKKEIDKGLKELKRRYKNAYEKLKKRGQPVKAGFWYNQTKANVSCKNLSNLLLDYITPIPKCWTCTLERGYKWYGADHQWVTCVSVKPTDGGDAQTVVYDLWSGNEDGESPKATRKEWGDSHAVKPDFNVEHEADEENPVPWIGDNPTNNPFPVKQ